MKQTNDESTSKVNVSRRAFLGTSALLGGSALLTEAMRESAETAATEAPITSDYPLAKPENTLFTTCLQCNTGCEIKVRLLNGVAVKIEGNPLSPRTLWPHLPYDTPLEDVIRTDGHICPKGQAGIQTVYDPYRITRVLKRAGKRGEGKWISVPFEQAIREIVEGGKLFSSIPGEENRQVTGLRELWALRDAKLAKAMAEDVENLRKKKMTVAEFKEKYKEHLHVLIDPDHPDLGPKNNQVVLAWGRLKSGRAEFFSRFLKESFGSVNAHGHTTVCQGSLYFTCKTIADQYRDGKWTGGAKAYWMADLDNAEFILYVGTSPLEANYGPPMKGQRLMQRITEGKLKIAVVDPRLSKTAAKAWKWVPARPGSEAALALAMTRWIIENNRYDALYLSNANLAAAKSDGEPTFSNASWLVRIEEGRPSGFVRAKDLGLGDEHTFVVWRAGAPRAVAPYDEKNAVEGELRFDGEINGVRCKTAFQVLYDSAASHTLEEWAEICGIPSSDIVELAREFTSHGKRAVVEPHRGVSQHTNGYYNVLAVMSLNLLIGNMDWKGGLMKGGGTFDQTGAREHKPFRFDTMHPAKTVPFGVSLIRHDTYYEESTLFDGYPAKRVWYPFSSDIYQEILPSALDAYPYPIKALILYKGTPAYSLPAGNINIEALTNLERLPLVIACDIVIGETSMYADYIFPDLTYLERWEFHGSHPSIAHKVSPVRQPVIAPLVETAKVYGEEIPLSVEALFLGLAEKLGLPGFGPDGLGPGADLKRPEDFYLRMVANIAAGDRPEDAVPDASDEEVDLFLRTRRHLPKTVFDPAKWERVVGSAWWRKVIYVLNRGGRFEPYERAWAGDFLQSKHGSLLNLFVEKVAKAKGSTTGKPLPGIAVYQPVMDVLGRPIEDKDFDLNLITHREIFATKSRTISNYWLLSVMPENAILMNRKDAEARGLKDGDQVRIISASNPDGVWDLRNGRTIPMIGQVKVIEGIRPGVITFALGWGHWAYGSSDVWIDGKRVRGDARRARGVHANAAMRLDDYLKNTCLVDPVGGSAVFYDTRVRVVRV